MNSGSWSVIRCCLEMTFFNRCGPLRNEYRRPCLLQAVVMSVGTSGGPYPSILDGNKQKSRYTAIKGYDKEMSNFQVGKLTVKFPQIKPILNYLLPSAARRPDNIPKSLNVILWKLETKDHLGSHSAPKHVPSHSFFNVVIVSCPSWKQSCGHRERWW